jgi:hypothetical protein
VPYTITYPPTADNQVRDFLRQLNLIPHVTIQAPGTLRVTDVMDAENLLTPLKNVGLFTSYTPSVDPVPNPPIFLNSITPRTARTNGAPFSLVIKGDGSGRFDSGCTVALDGISYPTTLTDTNTLTVAGLDPTTLGASRVILVTVQDNTGGPTIVSNPLYLDLRTALGPAPVLSSLSPSTASAALGTLTLSLQGNNFVDGDIVKWAGKTKTATFVSPTLMTVVIPAYDLIVGTVPVYVRHVDRQVSATVNFTVTA